MEKKEEVRRGCSEGKALGKAGVQGADVFSLVESQGWLISYRICNVHLFPVGALNG